LEEWNLVAVNFRADRALVEPDFEGTNFGRRWVKLDFGGTYFGRTAFDRMDFRITNFGRTDFCRIWRKTVP
jgi:hypothetical protein